MRYGSALTVHRGYIYSHRNNMDVLVKGYTTIVEANFEKQFNGENDWEVKYGYPTMGGGILLYDFGNEEMLGKGVSLIAYYKFPVVNLGNFSLNAKAGFGPGFIQKVWDREDNYKNYAVSTHLNGFAYVNFLADYRISDHLGVNGGLSITHFSNAAAKKPNLGINILSLNGGVNYRFHPVEKKTRPADHEFVYSKKWEQDVLLTLGRKQSSIGDEKYSKVFVASYDIGKHVSFKSKFGGGIDAFYNEAHKSTGPNDEKNLTTTPDVLQIGAKLSYTLQVSQFAFILNYGFYVYDKYKDDGSMYHRMALRYTFFEKMHVQLGLKTHWAVADHVEWTLGYRF
jgi:hypothetical protein